MALNFSLTGDSGTSSELGDISDSIREVITTEPELFTPSIISNIDKKLLEEGIVNILMGAPSVYDPDFQWQNVAEQLALAYPDLPILHPYTQDEITSNRIYGVYKYGRSVITASGSVPIGVGHRLAYDSNTSTFTYYPFNTVLETVAGSDDYITPFPVDGDPIEGVPQYPAETFRTTTAGDRTAADGYVFPIGVKLSANGHIWVSAVDLLTNNSNPALTNTRDAECGNFALNGKPSGGNSGCRGVYTGGSPHIKDIRGYFTLNEFRHCNGYLDRLFVDNVKTIIGSDLSKDEPTIVSDTYAGDARRIFNAGRTDLSTYGGIFSTAQTNSVPAWQCASSMSLHVSYQLNGDGDSSNNFGVCENFLLEHGQYVTDIGGMLYRNGTIHKTENGPIPLHVVNTQETNRIDGLASFEHIHFMSRDNFKGGWPITPKAELNIEHTGLYVSWRELTQHLTFSGALGKTSVLSILVSYKGVLLDFVSNYGPGMVTGAEFLHGKLIENAEFPDFSEATVSRIATANKQVISGTSWKTDTESYTYYGCTCADFIAKANCVVQTPLADKEKTVSMVNGETGIVQLFQIKSNGVGKATDIIYRRKGSVGSVGVYHEYALVPHIASTNKFDNGLKCSTFNWQDHTNGTGIPQPIHNFNVGWNAGLSIRHGVRTLRGKAAQITGHPIYGMYNIGDYAKVIGIFLDASGRVVKGWLRATDSVDGTEHTLGVDWIPDYADSTVASDPSGITGATAITNIVKISQADYDAIVTKDPETYYIIVG